MAEGGRRGHKVRVLESRREIWIGGPDANPFQMVETIGQKGVTRILACHWAFTDGAEKLLVRTVAEPGVHSGLRSH